MADKKITQLDEATSVAATDWLLAVVGGVSKKIAASLDRIADGSTYKRVAAAVATALNAGTYDPLIRSTGITTEDWNTYPGMHFGTYLTINCSGLNNPESGGYGIAEVTETASYVKQTYTKYDGTVKKERYYNGSSWTAWHTIWTALIDGNGGQPPAPKPNQSGITYRGQFQNLGVSGAAGSDVFLPNPEGGSTWAYFVFLYDATTGAVSVGGFNSGVGSGGSTALSGSPNKYGVGFAWRIA